VYNHSYQRVIDYAESIRLRRGMRRKFAA